MEQIIAVVSDVKNISELLEGASVDAARLVPSGGRLRLEMDLTRACPELQTRVRRGFVTRTKTPWTKSRLVLEEVAEASMTHADDRPAEQIPLLSCDAVPGGYTLTVHSPDGLRLQLRLEQLTGRFVDTASPGEAP